MTKYPRWVAVALWMHRNLGVSLNFIIDPVHCTRLKVASIAERIKRQS